jgi:hypothetical protein
MLEDIKHSGMFYRKEYMEENLENIMNYVQVLIKQDKRKIFGFTEQFIDPLKKNKHKIKHKMRKKSNMNLCQSQVIKARSCKTFNNLGMINSIGEEKPRKKFSYKNCSSKSFRQ